MIDFLPRLKDKALFTKLIALLLLIAIGMVLMMAVGLLLALPFFGTGILDSFTNPQDYTDAQTVNFLKYFQVINQIGVFILPVLAFAYLENRKINRYLRLNFLPKGYLLLLSLLMILSSIPAVNWMIGVNEQMHLPEFLKGIEDWMRETEDDLGRLTEAFLKTNSVSGFIINLVIIGVLAGVGEEFLFRGVILRIFLDHKINKHLAVLISSLIFSAFHMQFFGFMPRLYLGILLGYAFVSTGSLWTPIILHAIFNSISVTVTYLYERGLIAEIEGTPVFAENPVAIVLSISASIAFLIIIQRKSMVATGKTEE